MMSWVTKTCSRPFFPRGLVTNPSRISTPSGVGRIPGSGEASWSWRRAISGMGSSRNSGPATSASITKAPGPPSRQSVHDLC